MSQRPIVQTDEKLPIVQAVPLALQHLMAMFGATVLVPILTGLDPSVAIMTSGAGTILYLILTRGKIPSFLGSSFAFIAPIAAVAGVSGGVADPAKVPYALGGLVVAGGTAGRFSAAIPGWLGTRNGSRPVTRPVDPD